MNIDKAFMELGSLIPEDQLLRHECMKKHTSFRIGGPVDLMIIPSSPEQIKHSFTILKENHVPIMIMGNGSNLLVKDKGIRGAVIKIADRFKDITIENDTIKAQSGILLSALSRAALGSSLRGLEFASGIPGTLGGAVTMNAGAYGGEMKDVIQWVTVMDDSGKIVQMDKDGLALGYRTSAIQGSSLTVLEVFMKLEKGDYDESKALISELTKRRQEKQPLSFPSAGSVFKRPIGYYAGKLIQDAGLRGMKIGNAQVSELHSGFIINIGGATAQDVITLIELIQQRVKEQFGVLMQPEVKIVGEE